MKKVFWSYGVCLPFDYKGDVPPQMLMMEVPEAEYIVFEHGPFDYEQENRSVEENIEKAMADLRTVNRNEVI